MFCIDLNYDSSLDAVVMANISQDYNNGDSPLWSEQTMIFEPSDNKFHLKQDVYAASANTNGRFKGRVYHRKTDEDTYNPVWYGTDGYGNGSDIYVNFPDAGHYEVEFVLDPIRKTAPEATPRGYHDLTIGAYGYTTFSYNKVVDVPSGVTVRYITGQNSGTFTTETVTTKIPKTTTTPQAGTGVIFVGAAGAIHRLYWSADADQNAAVTLTGNKLSGTGNSSYAVTANDTYCFTQKDGVVGFYLATAGSYAANKAFLPASEVSGGGGGVREFFGIDFDDEETAIGKIVASQSDGTCYNLMGQPVPHPTKGLYIVNGRKVMMK